MIMTCARGLNYFSIAGVQAFYKASKVRFDSDPAFKERAQRAVVSLQVDYIIVYLA